MIAAFQIPEGQLISLLKEKDEKAFNYLYQNYSGAFYGLIIKMVVEEKYAEEIMQDVFMKIWKNIDQFDAEKGRLYTWMINIARNTSLDYLKSKGYQKEQKNQSLSNFVNDEAPSSFLDKDDSHVVKAERIGMKNIIDQIKPEWQLLIEMAYYQGYTQSEISERLNIPIGTVKTRTRNALIELKELLKDYQ